VAHGIRHLVLEDRHIKIHKRSVFMRALETARVEGNREAVDGVSKHVPDDYLSVLNL
jgi:hypothetical protein